MSIIGEADIHVPDTVENLHDALAELIKAKWDQDEAIEAYIKARRKYYELFGILLD